ncbi:MAG: c-type cytochrome [Gammaproteobacteria bacterium]|nr:c-type cytochrome [Xanthomonadales bacterium]
MYKFNNLTKGLTVTVLALAISACSQSNNSEVSQSQEVKSDNTPKVEGKEIQMPGAIAAEYKEISVKGPFNFGQTATDEEIAGWHIEVGHGHNLPPGSGTAADGEELFDKKCASCHGSFGEGVGRNPVLAGGEGTLTDPQKPERTVGSYWPYASTLIDYTHRAMPFPSAQSLTWDETWSISAYVLYLNDIIEDEEFVFSADTYHEIKMPNEDGFVMDKRPDTHNTRCMKDCKDPASLEIKTALLGYGSGAEDVVEETAVVEGHELGQKIYDATCRLCHGTGLAGAPKVEDTVTWEHRLQQGKSKVYEHAINGYQGQYGVMPPRGGNMELSDDDVKAAVDFMVKDAEL